MAVCMAMRVSSLKFRVQGFVSVWFSLFLGSVCSREGLNGSMAMRGWSLM
jgi:hypothetical protein